MKARIIGAFCLGLMAVGAVDVLGWLLARATDLAALVGPYVDAGLELAQSDPVRAAQAFTFGVALALAAYALVRLYDWLFGEGE